MTDTECLNWLESTQSGVYYGVNGLGPFWTVTSVPDGYRFNYRTCREAIIETAKRFPTKGALIAIQRKADEEEKGVEG